MAIVSEPRNEHAEQTADAIARRSYGKLVAILARRTGDIAAAVIYLVSEEAGYVTGQTLHVNGGMAMI